MESIKVSLTKIKAKLKSQAENAVAIANAISFWWNGEISLSYGAIITFLFSLLYVISPIDLIPDFIPFIGYFDDIALLLAAVKSFRFLITIAIKLQKFKKEPPTLKEMDKIYYAEECVICLSEKPQIFFADCKHMIVCESCSGCLRKCPYCMIPIKIREIRKNGAKY